MIALVGLACIGIYIIIGSFLKEVLRWDDDEAAMICFWPIIVPVMVGVVMVRHFIEAGEKLARMLKNTRRKNK